MFTIKRKTFSAIYSRSNLVSGQDIYDKISFEFAYTITLLSRIFRLVGCAIETLEMETMAYVPYMHCFCSLVSASIFFA